MEDFLNSFKDELSPEIIKEISKEFKRKLKLEAKKARTKGSEELISKIVKLIHNESTRNKRTSKDIKKEEQLPLRLVICKNELQ